MSELVAKILSLPKADRIQLIALLAESLQEDNDVTYDWQMNLVDEAIKSESEPIDWDQARQEFESFRQTNRRKSA